VPASYTIVHNKKHKSVKVATVVLPLLLSVRLNASIPAVLPFLRLLIDLLTSSRVTGPVLISIWIASSLLNSCVITHSGQLSTF